MVQAARIVNMKLYVIDTIIMTFND